MSLAERCWLLVHQARVSGDRVEPQRLAAASSAPHSATGASTSSVRAITLATGQRRESHEEVRG